jgi:uncharacterized membrane protein YkvA (DUF1232 family)
VRILRLFAATRRSLPRVFPLMRDAAVPMWLKAAAVVAALLIISPLDLLGDIPILGLLDDAALLLLACSLFVTLAERLRARAQPLRVAALRLPPA